MTPNWHPHGSAQARFTAAETAPWPESADADLAQLAWELMRCAPERSAGGAGFACDGRRPTAAAYGGGAGFACDGRRPTAAAYGGGAGFACDGRRPTAAAYGGGAGFACDGRRPTAAAYGGGAGFACDGRRPTAAAYGGGAGFAGDGRRPTAAAYGGGAGFAGDGRRPTAAAYGGGAGFACDGRRPTAAAYGGGAGFACDGRRPTAAASGNQRSIFLAAYASLASLREGHTRLPVVGDVGRAALASALAPLRVAISEVEHLVEMLARKDVVPELIGGPDERKPLLVVDGHLYSQRQFALEARVAAALRTRLQKQASVWTPQNIKFELQAVAADPPIRGGRAARLSDEQQRVLAGALDQHLTAISGGPGTGKTSIVASLLRLLVRLGVPSASIALAAPTGRAAHRLEQAVKDQLLALTGGDPRDAALLAECPEGKTLHRLLGYIPSQDRFRHHPNHPLEESVIILDESSMIDLSLMDHLLAALRPDAHLVLLGDADQLPPVEAGAPFRELSNAASAFHLTQSYRMDQRDPAGRNIFNTAQRIQAGDFSGVEKELTIRSAAADVAFDGAELLVQDPTAFLQRWSDRLIGEDAFLTLARRTFAFSNTLADHADTAALHAIFTRLDRQRLLCVTRGDGPTSVDAVNRFLHQRLRGTLSFRDRAAFSPGAPVMVVQNDPEHDLFNGDQGVILRAHGGKLMAVFPHANSFRVFDPAEFSRPLELAFATTVHRAQGSEFDQVALMLPDRDVPLLTRELVYTALTRSRKSAVIVGSIDQLRTAIGRQLHRFSGLGDRLRG